MKNFVGIDFGDSFVTIYIKNGGLILKEPSILSVQKKKNKFNIIALGLASQELEKTDNSFITFSPIKSGIIQSEKYAGFLLKYCLSKCTKTINSLLNAVVAVPFGINKTEIDKYSNMCKYAGLKNYRFISSLELISKNLNYSNPIILCNIGGSITDCALLYNNKLFKGASLGLGGNSINLAIVRLLEEQNFMINTRIAEEIKLELGSLFSSNVKKLDVVGQNLTTGEIEKRTIYAKDIFACINAFFDEITLLILGTINANYDIIKEQDFEIVFCGGTALTFGLENFMKKKLGKKTTILENSEDLVALSFKNYIN